MPCLQQGEERYGVLVAMEKNRKWTMISVGITDEFHNVGGAVPRRCLHTFLSS
jgi:hypothetical protein